MPKDYGQQSLLDYLAINSGELTLAETVKFFHHSHKTTTYAAIDSLVKQGKLRRRVSRGETYISLGATTSLKVPFIQQGEERSLGIQVRFEMLVAFHIKFLSQQRMLPARFRFVDAAREMVEVYRPAMQWINFLDAMLNTDLSVADVEQLEQQFTALYSYYNPNKDVWDSLDLVIDALNKLDVFDQFTDEQLESIKDFNDRRNVYQIVEDGEADSK